MSDPITKELAEEMFGEYFAASKAVSKGQQYTIDGRSLTRANLTEINKQLQYWRGQVMRFCSSGHGGIQVRSAIPHG